MKKLKKEHLVRASQIIIFQIGSLSIYFYLTNPPIPLFYPLNTLWGQITACILCFVWFYWITNETNKHYAEKNLICRYAYMLGKPTNAVFIESLFLIVSKNTPEDNKEFLRQIVESRMSPMESNSNDPTAIATMQKLKSNNIDSLEHLLDYMADSKYQLSEEERYFFLDLVHHWTKYETSSANV